MTIAEVLALTAETDDAFRLVDAYRAHVGAVYGAACQVCGPLLAEEVTQEVFVRLWRDSCWFDPSRGTLRSFLVAVARNKAVDLLRSEISRRDRERRSHECVGPPRARGYETAESEVVLNDGRARIADAVRGLPERERAALVTAFYGGCTYREAAAALGEPEGTVKSRIRAGLRHLAAALGEPSVDAVAVSLR